MKTQKHPVTLSRDVKKQLFKEFMKKLEPVLRELTDEILAVSTDDWLIPDDYPKTPFVKKYFDARNKTLYSARHKKHVALMRQMEIKQMFDRIRQDFNYKKAIEQN